MTLTNLHSLPPSALLKPEDAAQILGVSPITLNKWRWNGEVKLPYLKVGEKIVRYRKGDIEEFLDARRIENQA